MEYISTFKNICDASRKTGCRRNSINDTCTHRLRTSGGYIWMYEDEYIKHNYNENDIAIMLILISLIKSHIICNNVSKT